MNALAARILAAVTVAAGAAVLVGPQPVSVAGGLLLGFVLPGFALTATLLRGRTLTPVERTMLTPALSLAVLVIAGLAIYLSGFVLNRIAWTSATVGVTLVALIVPGVPLPRRSARRPAADPPSVTLTEWPVRTADLPSMTVADRRIRTADAPSTAVAEAQSASAEQRPPLARIARQLIPMVLVMAALGTASWLSLASSRHSYDVTVTTLSAAPPVAVEAAGRRTVGVTATGLVAADGPYSVVVTEPDGTRAARLTVIVPSSGTWTASLTMGPERMTVGLYRAGDTTAYRTLYIAAAE